MNTYIRKWKWKISNTMNQKKEKMISIGIH